MRFNSLTVLFFVCLVSIFLVDYVYSRGRGGGSRGGSRSGSYSSRSSRSSRSYSRSSSRSSRYGKYAAAAAAGYTVYGMSRYRTRYSYGSSYYREDPNICSNLDRYVIYDNKTISTTQKLTHFVCPYSSTDEDKDMYCCGPESYQYCCSYWESPAKGGAIAGIVVGSLVLIIVIVGVSCYCKRKRLRDLPEPSASYEVRKKEPAMTTDNSSYAPPINDSQGYPPYSAPHSNAIGFEGNVPPPTYDKLGNYPPQY